MHSLRNTVLCPVVAPQNNADQVRIDGGCPMDNKDGQVQLVHYQSILNFGVPRVSVGTFRSGTVLRRVVPYGVKSSKPALVAKL